MVTSVHMRVQSSSCCSGTLVLISVCVVRGKVMCDAHPGHVARVAEEVGIQREALRSRLIRQLLPTLLTVITLKVIIFVH